VTATLPAQDGVAALIIQHEIEQFYYAEARMLDERDYWGWLDLFSDDCRYLLPIRRSRRDGEFTDELGDGGLAHFDDDKETLRKRVTRMNSDMAWAEDPPSVQRHVITNVHVTPSREGGFEVQSYFQTHRYRLEREVEIFTGSRTDRLRPAGESFRIVERTVRLDHSTVLGNNLNLFL
jgi:3-phenylpropionate/cinnamic acid dioxygenase small subunit